MKKKTNYFIFILGVNVIVLIFLLYHEKILTAIDYIKMPIDETLCKQMPFNISKSSKTIDFDNLTIKQVESELKDIGIENGGKYTQTSSNKKSKLSDNQKKVAIIVPYRNRRRNLNIFLLYMHRFLSSQNINYGIFLIEPLESLKFNRALLLNIGFLEAMKDDEGWNCFIFHDVDMLPENSNNIYECDSDVPKQMAVSINTYSYSTDGYFKDKYFGGVNAFTRDQFLKINGFSNLYFEWGIEDDDARLRVLDKYSRIARPLPHIGRYFANCHEKQPKNPDRFILYIGASSRMDTDGLNSIKYDVVFKEKKSLYTKIFVLYTDLIN